jgi:hypothetical protein
VWNLCNRHPYHQFIRITPSSCVERFYLSQHIRYIESNRASHHLGEHSTISVIDLGTYSYHPRKLRFPLFLATFVELIPTDTPTSPPPLASVLSLEPPPSLPHVSLPQPHLQPSESHTLHRQPPVLVATSSANGTVLVANVARIHGDKDDMSHVGQTHAHQNVRSPRDLV